VLLLLILSETFVLSDFGNIISSLRKYHLFTPHGGDAPSHHKIGLILY